jgi:hypothetical protein
MKASIGIVALLAFTTSVSASGKGGFKVKPVPYKVDTYYVNPSTGKIELHSAKVVPYAASNSSILPSQPSVADTHLYKVINGSNTYTIPSYGIVAEYRLQNAANDYQTNVELYRDGELFRTFVPEYMPIHRRK